MGVTPDAIYFANALPRRAIINKRNANLWERTATTKRAFTVNSVQCIKTKQHVDASNAYRADTLQDGLYTFIKQDIPELTPQSYISIEELNKYRRQYLEQMLRAETGELNVLEQEVIDAIHNNTILSENIEPDIAEQLTLGQRTADHIAAFGGSWTFIIFFFGFIVVWMAINVWVLATQPFDPYPFILLNLILSCLAAIQAPIIMMSQNRQEQKDRIRSEHDYKINLKAELEIKLLHEKMDHLIIHQNKRLLEIQQIQTDYLNDILSEIRNNPK